MLSKVSLTVFLSLVSFTVSLNVITNLPTGKSTQDDVHDNAGLFTNIVDSYRVYSTTNQTLYSDIWSLANETNSVSFNSQNISTDTEFNGDLNQSLAPGNLSFAVGVKWEDVDTLLKLQAKSILAALNFKDAIRRTNASSVCKSGLEWYLNSLSALETWSVKMADASGIPQGGVLEGRLMSLGSYEECLKIRVESAEDGEGFQGKYCMFVYRSGLLSDMYLKNGSLNRQYLETYGEPPQWIQDFLLRSGPLLKIMRFPLGTCVPSTCTNQDLTLIANLIVSSLGMSVEVAGCQVEKPLTWTKSFIAAVSVLGSIAILCFLGTVADIKSRVSQNRVSEEQISDHSKCTSMKLLKMFSVPSNLEILFNSDNTSSFGCLNGIRFLASTWIVLFHVCFFMDPWLFLRFLNILELEEGFAASLPLAAIDNISIDIASFFFISGLLLSHFTWKKKEKGSGRETFVKFVIRKYLRFTPCIALTLAVFVVVVHTGSGPLWNSTLDPIMEACNEHWWKNFIYINNWTNLTETCLVHTWFVSCLMQFHIIGFFIIQVTFRWPIVGVFLGVMIVLGCGALTVIIVVLNNFTLPTTIPQRDYDKLVEWCELLRFKPFYYMQSYVIGMAVGYLVLKYKGKKIKQRYQAIGWILSIIGSAYAVYGVYGPASNIEFTASYYALNFIAWSASFGWFVYACLAGYGGIINRFLSWKGFHFLSNISFLIYLLHFIVIFYHVGSAKEIAYYGFYEMISSFLSILAIATFLAFVGHVTVEMPFNHLEKFIFS